MLIKGKGFQKIAAVIGIRICLLLGLFGLILSLIFILLPNSSLISLATKFAIIIGDSQRIASAGLQRLQFELGYIVQRLKFIFPFFSFLLLLWAILWRFVSNKASDEDINTKATTRRHSLAIPYFTLLGLAAIAVLLRIVNFNQSLWFDEIYSVLHYIDKGSFLKALTTFKYFNNHILYSFLARASMLIFGKAEWALRLPALILGIAGIWALTKLASLLGNKRIILISAILLVFSPLHIDQSQQARGYTALLLFSILSCYFFLRCIKESKAILWWGFVVASVLGLYFHLYMSMVLLSQIMVVLLTIFLLKEGRRDGFGLVTFQTTNSFFLYTTIIATLTLLLYLPTLPFILFELLRPYATKNINPSFIFSVFQTLSSGKQGLDFSFAYILLFLWGIIFMWRKERIFSILSIIMFAISFCINSIFKPIYLYPRFFMFMLPIYLVIIAAAIDSLAQILSFRNRHYISIILTIFLISASLPSINTIWTQDRQNYREAAQYINTIAARNSAVIAPGVAGEELRYYLSSIPVIKIKTIKEVQELLERFPQAIFFVTFESGFSCPLLDFIRNNCYLRAAYSSRLPIKIYSLKEGIIKKN